MTAPRSACRHARGIVPALVRGLAVCLAASAATAPMTAAGSDDGKNHYILDCEPLCVDTTTRGPTVPTATQTAIGAPGAVATDRLGNVYFSSQNIVFRLDARRSLTRIAGNGWPGFAGDGGPAVDALLNFPVPTSKESQEGYPWLTGGLAVDAGGAVYIADGYNDRIRKIDPYGVIATIAASGVGGPGVATYYADDWRFAWPQGIAIDADRSVYVSTWFGTVTRIAADGTVAVLAEDSCHEIYGASWYCPAGPLALSGDRAAYFGDGYCRVRRIDADGEVATWVGDERSIYYRSGCGYGGEGTGASVTRLTEAAGVAVDENGEVYFADMYNHCVRKVDREHVVHTVAGICTRGGFAGDGGPASEANLAQPSGIAIDRRGNLYIADSGNRRVRKVSRTGLIDTVAGNGDALVP